MRRGEAQLATIRFWQQTRSDQIQNLVVCRVNGEGGLLGGLVENLDRLHGRLTIRGDAAFLNACLDDADGERVLEIRDNLIILNKDNIYSTEQLRPVNIPPAQVIVTNRYGARRLSTSVGIAQSGTSTAIFTTGVGM